MRRRRELEAERISLLLPFRSIRQFLRNLLSGVFDGPDCFYAFFLPTGSALSRHLSMSLPFCLPLRRLLSFQVPIGMKAWSPFFPLFYKKNPFLELVWLFSPFAGASFIVRSVSPKGFPSLPSEASIETRVSLKVLLLPFRAFRLFFT